MLPNIPDWPAYTLRSHVAKHVSYNTLVQMLLGPGTICSWYACGAWKQAPHVAGACNSHCVADSMSSALQRSHMLCASAGKRQIISC